MDCYGGISLSENKLRNCIKDPIPEIYDASRYLDAAVSAHLAGELSLSEELIRLADMPIIREWTESMWGSGGMHSSFKQNLGDVQVVSKGNRDPVRMPNKMGERALHKRDGFNCRFCGIPVIRKEVRQAIKALYPNVLQWGKTNTEQHAAFQAMWVQYDHVIPHARGGATDISNMVITCAPCNYGRMNYLLEEVGVVYPNLEQNVYSTWDGLERIIKNSFL